MISVEVNVAIIKCNEIIRCVKIFPSDSIKKLPNTGIDQLIQAKEERTLDGEDAASACASFSCP